jgi:hypothetical protein
MKSIFVIVILTGIIAGTGLLLNGCQQKTNEHMAPSMDTTTDIRQEKASEEVSENVIYTCPMHPEVISDKPGTCPECGMFLEKKEVKAQ